MKEKTNNSIFDFIVNNVDIVSVVRSFITLQKKGNNYWGLCPFHGDKNPSLSVSPIKKIYKCFVCGNTGNVINFVSNFKNITTFGAVEYIKELSNLKDSRIDNYLNAKKDSDEYKFYEINKQAANVYYRTLFNKENSEKLEYLLNRNLTKDLINQYQIGYAPLNDNGKYIFSILTNEKNILNSNNNSHWTPKQLLDAGILHLDNSGNYKDFFWNRIIIPIFDLNNNIVGFSGRTLNKNEKSKYINSKTTQIFKKEEILFNFNNFNKSDFDEIYIVEGFMDVFSFRRIGIENVVASMGTSFTDKQIKSIASFKNIKTIIICFDNDIAGKNATIELVEKLKNYNFSIFIVKPYDSKYKDIDEYLKDNGISKTIEIVKSQITFINYLSIHEFNDPNLSQKEKIINCKKIIDLINNFAYNNLTIRDDLSILSKYSGVDFNNLLESIHHKFKFINQTLNELNKYNHNDFELNKINNNNINYFVNDLQKNKNKEIQLINLISINTYVAKMYLKYIGHIYFQETKMHSMFTLLIIFIKKLIDLSYEINPTNIIELLRSEVSKTDYHFMLISYLENINNSQQNNIDEKLIQRQGIRLIKDLVCVIYNKVKKQIIYDDIDVSKCLESLTNKFNKNIFELNKIIENLG